MGCGRRLGANGNKGEGGVTNKEKLAEIRQMLSELDTIARDSSMAPASFFFNLGIFSTRLERLTRPDEETGK